MIDEVGAKLRIKRQQDGVVRVAVVVGNAVLGQLRGLLEKNPGILAETGLNPQQLDLELTEGIMMHDIDAVANDLKQVMKLGVRISIDDFGTGFSSLGYVKRFPAHRIKIDQSFIRNLCSDSNDMAIVKAIMTLGRSLGLKIVAEGVETLDQANLLLAEGCDEVQGYYFGRPMPAEDFRALIHSQYDMTRSA